MDGPVGMGGHVVLFPHTAPTPLTSVKFLAFRVNVFHIENILKQDARHRVRHEGCRGASARPPRRIHAPPSRGEKTLPRAAQTAATRQTAHAHRLQQIATSAASKSGLPNFRGEGRSALGGVSQSLAAPPKAGTAESRRRRVPRCSGLYGALSRRGLARCGKPALTPPGTLILGPEKPGPSPALSRVPAEGTVRAAAGGAELCPQRACPAGP